MSRNVYERFQQGVLEVDPFFLKGRDCVGNALSTMDQKIVTALCQMSLEVPADRLVGIIHISDSLMN